MICLTGDIHHQSLGTGNQAHSDISEVEAARRALVLLEDAGVKVTFFVSGRTFDEQWPELAPVVEHSLVEVGGHNYDCFTPALAHRVWKKLLGSYNGPPWTQRRDCLRTVAAIERRTGRRIRLWRNHMYMHGPFTDRVLASCGIELCSDGVRRTAHAPRLLEAGLFDFPLNVMPDHEHLYHAERTPEWVAWWVRRYRFEDDFGSESYFIDEWVERVLAQLRDNEARGVVSNMIVHPITMYLADDFAGFRRIVDYLASRETVWLGEVLERARAGGDAPRFREAS